MKSIRGRNENGVVLVKVLVKPFAEVDVEEYKQQIISGCSPPRPHIQRSHAILTRH